ncbi:flagellar export chaperone FliS [Paenibacillus thermotolerans]|uniref:flagellar export chaperone FliS n=1 Tax=Paenibacillus thermotolerans TaxID=3027807 RepID=UPI0023684FD4|nr:MULTISPECIES: flagellar export chaperone FliS [unclassified Paenibacillus]
MIQQQPNKYLETAVQTASPQQLLIMLYDGGIRFCRAGAEAIRQKRYEDANKSLCRVQDIINEFIITLDRNAPVAKGLLALYEYMNHQLIQANIKKDEEIVQEVLGYLQELKETWVQAAKSAAGAGPKHG